MFIFKLLFFICFIKYLRQTNVNGFHESLNLHKNLESFPFIRFTFVYVEIILMFTTIEQFYFFQIHINILMYFYKYVCIVDMKIDDLYFELVESGQTIGNLV